jgi:hypothetical protein
VFLVNSRHPHFSATPFGSRSKSLHLTEAHLLPKLRCQFAEFLDQGSLKRLRILTPPTCVGLRYGHQISSLEAFLDSMGSVSLFPKRDPHHLSVLIRGRIYLPPPPTSLNPDIHHRNDLPFCVPPSLKRQSGGTGILTCFPSPTLFSLSLGTDSP